MYCKQTGRRRGGQVNVQADRQTGRQTDRQAGRQAGRQADRQTGRQTERRTDGQTDKRTGHRPTDRQTDRPTDRQIMVVSQGPGLFREVRQTGRIHFHRVSSKSDHGRPSYDQKLKQPRQIGSRTTYLAKKIKPYHGYQIVRV